MTIHAMTPISVSCETHERGILIFPQDRMLDYIRDPTDSYIATKIVKNSPELFELSAKSKQTTTQW